MILHCLIWIRLIMVVAAGILGLAQRFKPAFTLLTLSLPLLLVELFMAFTWFKLFTFVWVIGCLAWCLFMVRRVAMHLDVTTDQNWLHNELIRAADIPMVHEFWQYDVTIQAFRVMLARRLPDGGYYLERTERTSLTEFCPYTCPLPEQPERERKPVAWDKHGF
jgi:hypothetical protein